MRKFLREGLSSAMAKCIEDSAVAGWSQETQNQIMAACMHLVELAVAVLEVGPNLTGCYLCCPLVIVRLRPT